MGAVLFQFFGGRVMPGVLDRGLNGAQGDVLDLEDRAYHGGRVPDHVAVVEAGGRIDPITLEVLETPPPPKVVYESAD